MPLGTLRHRPCDLHHGFLNSLPAVGSVNDVIVQDVAICTGSTLPAAGCSSGVISDIFLTLQNDLPVVDIVSDSCVDPLSDNLSCFDLSDPGVLPGYYDNIVGGNSFAPVHVIPVYLHLELDCTQRVAS